VGVALAEHMSFKITLMPFNRAFECEEDESILVAGLRAGFNLRFGCKEGGCGSCKARIISGDTETNGGTSFALMDFEKEEGYALLCSTLPLSDVTIELYDYKEEELIQKQN
jgi:ferredoxin